MNFSSFFSTYKILLITCGAFCLYPSSSFAADSSSEDRDNIAAAASSARLRHLANNGRERVEREKAAALERGRAALEKRRQKPLTCFAVGK